MGLYIAHHDVYSLFLCLMGRLQHGVGFSNSCGITKKYF